MTTQGVRNRAWSRETPTLNGVLSDYQTTPSEGRHGVVLQYIRMLAFVTFFLISCILLHASQLVVAPIYFVNQDYYYSFMAYTKQSFGLIITTISQWFCPVKMRISAEPGVAEQLRLNSKGVLEVDFPNRIVLIGNHLIYTDWLYLWWIAYSNRLHGHIFIILKQSLRFIPILGPGMMFYGFIFMARSWAKDQSRLQYRLRKLNKSRHTGPMSTPGGKATLDPMWLLIFPEGTNMSANAKKKSKEFAAKQGIDDMKHTLLPRSTGLLFCLRELKETVEWVYDCTIAYEGIPPNEYGEEIFTLWAQYFQGRAPPSVNMYWRRFRISDIPLDDSSAFEIWLRQRWQEKDALIDNFMRTGKLPPSKSDGKESASVPPYLETTVQQRYPAEILLIYLPTLVLVLLGLVVYKLGGWLSFK